MKAKTVLKRIVDVLMLALLLLLMLEIQIGQEAHEWLGVGMLALWISHNALNSEWWKSAWRGKYSPSRALGTAVNLLLALALSGVMMSGFVFAFLPLRGGMILARRLHLLASHWGLLLMSAHLGMHLERILHLNRRSALRTPAARILRGAVALVSIYGIYAFFALHLPDYLFLRTAFVLYDETKAAWVYMIEILAVMDLFAAAFHCLSCALRAQNRRARGKLRSGAAWKAASFALPAAVCLAVIVGMNAGGQSAPWESAPAEPIPEIAASVSEAASPVALAETTVSAASIEDGFVFVKGGSFAMGCPEDEPWRSADETQHTVSVSDFYISP